ncbi:class I SAM-dependent methyltransferase [Methylorubrum populi]
MSTNCPLCGLPPRGVIQTFTAAQTAELFTSRVLGREPNRRMEAILKDLWHGETVQVMRCDRCDFGYADPFVAGTAEFYQLEAPDTPYPRDKWEYRHTLQQLAGWSAQGATLLDIGAGKGYFLSQLIEAGWNPGNLMATEFSAAGRRAIEGLGVTCHPTDVRALEVGERRFDAICLFQVLEHLDGYDALMDAVSRLATPKAHLFIAVPNGARIDFNEENGLQYDCPPNHVSRWRPKSFQVFAEKYGWTLEGCALEPAPSLRDEAVYGAVNRFIRQSHVPGTWARTVYAAARRLPNRRAGQAVKALGLAASPDAWRAGARVARAAAGGGVPHALWAHLRRRV